MIEDVGPKNNKIKEPQRQIRIATTSDIDGIISIQNKNLLPSINITDSSKLEFSNKGFLVYPVTNKELEKIVDEPKKHILIVASNGNEIEGYILAYDFDTWKTEKPSWRAIINNGESLDDKKILYFRHITVKPGSGIAIGLENNLFSESKKMGYQYIIGEILRKPIHNNRSMEFHKRIGFNVIGEIQEKNMTWDLVLKDLK